MKGDEGKGEWKCLLRKVMPLVGFLLGMQMVSWSSQPSSIHLSQNVCLVSRKRELKRT